MVTTNKLPQQLSIKLGNILFKYAFPVYNRVYPWFKRKQDADEIAFLKLAIKPGHTILDIGANIGFYSGLLGELTGEKGIVYAFEPDPVNHKHLLKNTAGIVAIRPFQKAVAEKTKTLELYTSKLLNVDHRTYKVDDYDQAISIEAVSIDEFLPKGTKVDFIKMDIQGFEFSALQGMKETIANNTEIKIVMELWPFGLKKAGTDCIAIVNYLISLNLSVFELDKGVVKPLTMEKLEKIENAPFEFGMNIFVKKQ